MENKDLDKQLPVESETSTPVENTSDATSTEQTETLADSSESQSVESSEESTLTEESTQSESVAESESQDSQLDESTQTESVENEDTNDSDESVSNISIPGFDELLQKAKEIAASYDWQNGGFLLKELKGKWQELSIPEGLGEVYRAMESALKEAEDTFFTRRKTHYEEMDKRRKDNLELKKGLLDKVDKLIERKKWAAQNELKNIQNKWEQIKNIPNDVAEELNTKFEQLVDTFEKNRVDYFVKKKEQEELNLEGKLYVLDRFKSLTASILPESTLDWSQLDHEFELIQQAWRKIGKITNEKADEIWNEFKQLKDDYYSKKAELNTTYKKEIETNERKKRALIDRAKQLLDHDDLAEAAREINRLHKEWKDIGLVAPDKADELWNEFKEASDAFNNYKNSHTDEIKEQEKTNYDIKNKLCEEAEKLAETDDWKKGTDRFQELLNEWRAVGPVPRRKTKKVWQRFKKAMDNFYARKRQHVKEVRNDEKDNLQRKRDIIDLIRALENAEDMQAAMTKVKELQQEYNTIGYVPIKFKDKIFKAYKEACDIFYKQARSRRNESSSTSAHHHGSDHDYSNADTQSKLIQIQKMKRQADKLNETILNYSDTKTFIKPNKKGLQLRDEIDLKISALQKEVDAINQSIDLMKKEIESGKSGSEN